MKPERLVELAALCERAAADEQSVMLTLAFNALDDLTGAVIGYDRFLRMIGAEAYESAALTLVPPEDRWPWNVTIATAYRSVSVIPNHGDSYGVNDPYAGHSKGNAATVALALAAASLRATAQMMGEK